MNAELIHLTEPEARRLLLARAVDEADAQQRLVGAVEREQVEREALARAGDPALGKELDAKAYLLERARRLIELVSHRQPRIAALAEPAPWIAFVAWLLPAVALVAGAVLDRIDNPHQVNLLSPPLLMFLLWNFAVYVALAVMALRPGRHAHASRWPSWPWPRVGGVRAQVVARFQAAWWQVAGALEGQRWRRILHFSAAAWGVGVALSIVLGGLVREYRVGWESTLLDLPQVHAFLRVLFSPVIALTPLQPFSIDDLARLHFRAPVEPGREEARHWVYLYLALIALVVVLPRLALATWAAARQRFAARAIAVPVDDGYFRPLLGRVRPVRLNLLLAGDGEGMRRLTAVLRQAGGEAGPLRETEAWTALRTDRGDALSVAIGPSLDPDSRADLLVWSTAGEAMPRVEAGWPLVVFAADGAAAAKALHAAHLEGPVVGWDALRTWRQDALWREAVLQRLPAWQAPGVERLWFQWSSNAEERLGASARLLADELAQAARDAQTLASEPAGVRQYVMREGRDAAQSARKEAMAALLDRVRQRRATGDRRLFELHALDARDAAAGDEVAGAFRIDQAIHESQAGLAGAASGAAMGAAVDLMTGGLTLGAASALGALVGGGAALVAAAWKNRATPADRTTVALGEDMLRGLAQGALVRYLRVAHAGRGEPDEAEWRAQAETIVREDTPRLDAAWFSLRDNENAAGAEAALAAWLRDAMTRALEGARPPSAAG
ncbi:DUF3482 domain-containing protein [Ramlibacter humi]|uniref:DUF3482 domain-containing protein n=1 Tax=Ramlibacter humi TaxID=2530451 RepID=A0A4Z0CB26_9BURK|nr:DUF3482 domain-containing protein [Ramlibacter humi]TFZ08112.1 DUF3482 domain-containing protein [Ramlibacter humi]